MSIKEAFEVLASECVGTIILVISNEGEVHTHISQANLVLPIISAEAGNVLKPKEIISTIENINLLNSRKARPAKGRRGRPSKAAETQKTETPKSESPNQPQQQNKPTPRIIKSESQAEGSGVEKAD